MTMRCVVFLTIGCLLLSASCGNRSDSGGTEPGTASGSTTASTTASAGGWVSVPPGPLSPRAGAVGVWTGAEVLVVGGEPEPWCPPSADCTPPGFASLVDGAVYDPATETWRTIADAPLPLSGFTSPVVVDDAVYLLARGASGRPGAEDGFLRYMISEDRWEQPASPPGDLGGYLLVGVPGTVVAYRGSDETGDWPDSVFDVAAGAWEELPADPFSPSYDRQMAVVGDGLYLFAKDVVPNPNGDRPSLARVARYDLSADGGWEVLSDSEILGTWSPATIGTEIVFPWPGEADGGRVGNWGRAYPYGGSYDTETDTWFALPEPSRDDGFAIAGVFDSGTAAYLDVRGSALDLARNEWIEIPDVPGGDDETFNRTIVAAGEALFAFGGESWADPGGRVLDTAHLWTPTG